MLLSGRNKRGRALGSPLVEMRRVGLLDRIANGIGSLAKAIKDCQQYGAWAVM
jgi:hypothetical protein